MARWRENGTGPVYFQVNGIVRYPLSGLRAFLAAHTKEPRRRLLQNHRGTTHRYYGPLADDRLKAHKRMGLGTEIRDAGPVVMALWNACKAAGGFRAWAKAHGKSVTRVRCWLSGDEPISPVIARELGFRYVPSVRYEPLSVPERAKPDRKALAGRSGRVPRDVAEMEDAELAAVVARTLKAMRT